MLIPMAVSCGATAQGRDSTETSNETKTGSNDSTETQKEVETKTIYEAHYPAGTDFNKGEFRILTWDQSNSTWYDCDFSAETYTGDTVNDAAYARMKQVEEELNCVIVPIPDASSASVEQKLATEVTSGGKSYDAAVVTARRAFNLLAQAGHLVNFNTIENFEIDQPWWDQDARSALSMGGKLYTMAGDISILYRKCLRVYYFNKAMHRNAGLENFYDLVENKEWTIEKMVEAALQVSEDADGNGIYDENDVYGLIATVDTITTGLIGAGIRYTEKDEDDYPELCFYSDDTLDTWDSYVKILFDKQSCVMNNASDRMYDTTKMFQMDQVLMSNCELHNLANFRKMETDFGILPTPMFDEFQDNYLSTVNPVVCGLIVIPVTNKELSKTAIVLDALGAASKNELTPAYYDVYLQGQTARDEESTVCLDIIFNNVEWDIGNIYNWGNIATFMQTLCKSYSNNFASTYAALEGNAQTELEKTISAFEKLDD